MFIRKPAAAKPGMRLDHTPWRVNYLIEQALSQGLFKSRGEAVVVAATAGPTKLGHRVSMIRGLEQTIAVRQRDKVAKSK